MSQAPSITPDDPKLPIVANVPIGIECMPEPEVTLVYDTVEDGVYTLRVFRAREDRSFDRDSAAEPLYIPIVTQGGTIGANPTIDYFAVETFVKFDVQNPPRYFYKTLLVTHPDLPTTNRSIVHRLLADRLGSEPNGAFETIDLDQVDNSTADPLDQKQFRPYDLVCSVPVSFRSQWKRVSGILATPVPYFLQLLASDA